MKVLVIGSGNMGSGLVKQFSKAGHEVSVFSRNAAQAAKLASDFGAVAAQPGMATQGVDVVVIATAYADAIDAIKAAGDVSGKVLIDISNPLTVDYMGLTIGHSTSAAEQIATAFPGAKVVKAFNTVFAQVLAQGAAFGAGHVVPVYFAGDDAAAKATVSALIASAGFEPVDAGPLKNARYLEPVAGLNIYFGYGAGKGTSIAPFWIARA